MDPQSNPPDTSLVFDPDIYIFSLMESMGLEGADDWMRQQIWQELSVKVKNLVMNTLSQNVEPEELDEIMALYGNDEDVSKFAQKLIEISPTAQLAIVDALDRFYAEMLEAYESIKNKK